MAEMLFNRSFEPYMPYRDNSLTWFGLWRDENDHSKGYKTDWREMSWYHSGYEHNSWFAAPGGEGPFSIDRKSTFFLLRSPVRNVRIELLRGPGDVRHGLQSVRLINDDPAEWGALAQEGKYLRKGETYNFRGLLRTDGKPVDAEIRFYPRGQWRNPIAVSKLANIGAEFSLKTATFRNDSIRRLRDVQPVDSAGRINRRRRFLACFQGPISTAGAKTWSERSRRSSQSCFDFRADALLPSTTGEKVLDPWRRGRRMRRTSGAG